jgi:hypothetical protein
MKVEVLNTHKIIKLLENNDTSTMCSFEIILGGEP